MSGMLDVPTIHAELYPGHTQPVLVHGGKNSDSTHATLTHGILPSERKRFCGIVDIIKHNNMLLQTPDYFEHLYHERWYGNVVHVANSPLHGKGLFSTSAIPAWSIVTFFPADYVEHAKLVSGGLVRMFQPTRYSYGEQCDPFDAMLEIKESERYSVTLNDLPMSALATPTTMRARISGDPHKQRYGQLGHYINDPGRLASDASPAEYARYLSSYTSSNAMFLVVANYTVAVVSTRDIYRGEEILVSYGESFWSPSIDDRQFSSAIQHQRNARDAISDSITACCIDMFSHAR